MFRKYANYGKKVEQPESTFKQPLPYRGWVLHIYYIVSFCCCCYCFLHPIRTLVLTLFLSIGRYFPTNFRERGPPYIKINRYFDCYFNGFIFSSDSWRNYLKDNLRTKSVKYCTTTFANVPILFNVYPPIIGSIKNYCEQTFFLFTLSWAAFSWWLMPSSTLLNNLNQLSPSYFF